MQSDQRLSDLYRRGVDPAFDELVDRYRASLVAFAGAIVGSARAEDVVQDALVKAHRAMATDEVDEPRAWLYRIVRNTALNEIRDGRKHEHSELAETEAAAITPEREVEGREELKALVTALAALPEAQRQAIVDRELGGYTHEQIARELEISTGATKQLIFRARKGLRNAFGALIPVPVIVWLASEMSGAFAAASSAGAVVGAGAGAGGAGGAAAGAGAGAGGIFAGLAGGGAAKVAAVAVVATGTVAAGVAVEERVVNADSNSGPAIERTADDFPGGIEFTGDGTPVLVPGRSPASDRAGSNREADGRGRSSEEAERLAPDRAEDRLDALEEGSAGPGEIPARPVGERPGGGERPPRPSGGTGRPGGRPDGGRPSGNPGSPGGGGRPATGPGGSGGSRPATKPGGPGGSGAGPGGSASGSRPSTGSGGPGGTRPSGGTARPGGGKPSGRGPSLPGS